MTRAARPPSSDEAVQHARPVIFNTDQCSRFTSADLTRYLLDTEMLISMDGRWRALENAFIERLWRSVSHAAYPVGP